MTSLDEEEEDEMEVPEEDYQLCNQCVLCVCVCVKESNRERESERDRGP